MPFQAKPLVLNEDQRSELENISGSQSLPAGFVLRAKIVLLWADGWSYSDIVDKLDTSTSTVGKWKRRFLAAGLDGLETERPGQTPQKLTSKMRARILNATGRKPRDGSTHWSTRKLADQLGVSKTMVHRVWQETGLSRIGWNATWPRTIRTSSAKRLTSLAYIWIHRNTQRSSASMKRRPFKRSIDGIACCRSHRGESSGTASRTSATARSRCMRR